MKKVSLLIETARAFHRNQAFSTESSSVLVFLEMVILLAILKIVFAVVASFFNVLPEAFNNLQDASFSVHFVVTCA
ncbi:hypothetical protein, partial [Salmonella sp. s51933]|uniref:hypothetical protein n=1 Tax=Salmonella sp. s51933 TaxID=3160127 RepID=UPI003754AF5F